MVGIIVTENTPCVVWSVPVSKGRRKATTKVEKSKGVTSVSVEEDYYSITSQVRHSFFFFFLPFDLSEVGIFYSQWVLSAKGQAWRGRPVLGVRGHQKSSTGLAERASGGVENPADKNEALLSLLGFAWLCSGRGGVNLTCRASFLKWQLEVSRLEVIAELT